MRAAIAIIGVILIFGGSFFLKQGTLSEETAAPDAAFHCGRIVSMSPGITESLFALGLGDKVVGVTRYCNYPPAALDCMRIGGFLDPNYELLVALRPDMILLTPFHRTLQPVLDRLGLRHQVISQDTMDAIRSSYEELGALCDCNDSAQRLVSDMDAHITEAAQHGAARPRLRVLMVTGRESASGSLKQIYAISSGSFLSDLLTIVGGDNCVEGQWAEYPAISAEGILELDPDLIIEFGQEDSEAAHADALQAWQSLGVLEAVLRGRVYYLGGAQYTIPGPRLIETLDALERCFNEDEKAMIL